MVSESTEFWKKCSTCKKPIPYGGKFWVCNVTTCNTKRLGLSFCSVPCWDSHVPLVRHRDSWAIEKIAPSREAWERELSGMAAEESGSNVEDKNLEKEVLIVVSKLKAYIKAKSGGMSTSGDVSDLLSDRLRLACDEAIQSARQDGRKTVMARDFK
jgi:hypothetical protein